MNGPPPLGGSSETARRVWRNGPQTVGQLVECLSVFPDEMPVVAYYDSGMAGGSIVKVEIGPGPDDNRESVVLMVE